MKVLSWKSGGFRKNFGTHTKRKCELGELSPVGDFVALGSWMKAGFRQRGLAGSIRVSLAVNRD